jgi:hypothetical protein
VLDDLSDPSRSLRGLSKRVERMPVQSAAGDPGHAGAGSHSILLGTGAEANQYESIGIGHNAVVNGEAGVGVGASLSITGYGGVAFGDSSQALADFASAFGYLSRASHLRSTAIGRQAQTTASDQIMLGRATDTVVVAGTLSTPSARRLKRNICTAPKLGGLFPDLYEWEYRSSPGRRQIGPLADDFLGTDAERFLTYDAKGRVSGIEKLDLHTAQIYALLDRLIAAEARIADLEATLRAASTQNRS